MPENKGLTNTTPHALPLAGAPGKPRTPMPRGKPARPGLIHMGLIGSKKPPTTPAK
jgi:hypothetical protein